MEGGFLDLEGEGFLGDIKKGLRAFRLHRFKIET